MTTASQAGLPEQAPVEVLELKIGAEGLGGPGGERLRKELRGAQFIAVGEDHGLADSPAFTAALASEAERVPGAPLYHVVEVGPHSTRLIGQALAGGGLAQLHHLLAGKPAAAPFLSNADDAQLALPFARRNRLWGIDQEFIGATGLLLDALIARTGDAKVIAQLRAWRDADLANLPAGKFDKAVLSSTDLAAFEALRPHFSKDPVATQILADLIVSAEIYQYNEKERYFENNAVRSQVMKRNFLERYRAVKGPAPRVIFKMGAYHLGRGITPTAQFDLGSLLPGLAAAQGRTSLHIAMVPIAGTVRTIAPSASSFTTTRPYDEDAMAKLLSTAGIAVDRLPAQGHVLIPLAPIRTRLTGKQLRDLDSFSRFVVLGFDYLVTTRDAKPATHFEAWHKGGD